jgi:hypothetical protein
MLSKTCTNSVDETVCVYVDTEQGLAAIDGEINQVSFLSSELYKRSIKESDDSLSIKISTGFSVIDYNKVTLELDKTTGSAEISYKNLGYTPFQGLVNIFEIDDFICQ